MAAKKGEIYAAIDIGTNTVLCLAARLTKGGKRPQLEVLEDTASLTRLGESLSQNSVFTPQAMERTIAALSECCTQLHHLHVPMQNIQVLGTAGLRRATNSAEFIAAVVDETGFEIQVISGEREAELSFLGVYYGLSTQLEKEQPLLVMDIGGGSTELILAEIKANSSPKKAMEFSTSLPLGSVWLTEKFLKKTDPPPPSLRAQMTEEIRRVLKQSGISWPVSGQQKPFQVIGIAGTVTTLATLHQELAVYDAKAVHGSTVPRDKIAELIDDMAEMPLKERQKLPGLEPKRADVIVAGATIALEVLKHAGAQELWVSDQGLRFGALYEILYT